MSSPYAPHLTPAVPVSRWTGLLIVALVLSLGACRSLEAPPADQAASRPIDPEATDRTRALFHALRTMDDRVLFGHQDALAYGVRWIGDGDRTDRSDVKAVTGAHPAVYGWDVGDIGNSDTVTVNLDSVPFDAMQAWMIDGYERGGVVTVSWHMDNPVSGGGSWDTTAAVAKILPGGSHHDNYVAMLDRFARFADDLESGVWSWLGLGHHVPIIFRPLHEMTGDWFWWGVASPDDYKALWRFTVEYLRDEKDLHHLLYAYSPDSFQGREDYLRYYPGDDYVDVLGYDDYHSLSSGYERLARVDTVAADAATADAVVPRPGPDTLASGAPAPDSVGLDSVYVDPVRADSMAAATLADRLRTVVEEAEQRGKVPAFTETGYEGVPDSTWWTDRVLPALNADSTTREMAYMLVWRNANERRNPGHHFAPHPGHPSADDFVQFYRHPLTVFEDAVPNLYE